MTIVLARKVMLRIFALSTIALAVIAVDARPVPAAGLSWPVSVSARERCQDLVAFFDRWGATRSGQSDGARNHTRIAANIDCEHGRYDAGIAEMEALLAGKKFEVPVDVGQAPMYFPDEEVAEASAR
jgi:hypothetical protein